MYESNQDYFVAYNILDILLSDLNKYNEYWQAQYHCMLGGLLIKWNNITITSDEI